MIFEVLLPLTLLLIMIATSILYGKYERKIQSLLGGRELRLRDVVLMVVAMGIMVTILAFISELDIIRAFFLCSYSLVLFLFTYLVVPKWYLDVLSPAFFLALYFFYWNEYFLNLFAIVFAIFVSIYLGGLFTWKTTAAFVALLTFVDVVQVFGTRFMVAYGQRVAMLGLPAMIIIPTFPAGYPEGRVFLGLGDVFLTGLLVIQTTQKYGQRFGYVTAATIAAIFMLFETVLLNFVVGYFPATIMVVCGWLTAVGAKYLHNHVSPKHAKAR